MLTGSHLALEHKSFSWTVGDGKEERLTRKASMAMQGQEDGRLGLFGIEQLSVRVLGREAWYWMTAQGSVLRPGPPT